MTILPGSQLNDLFQNQLNQIQLDHEQTLAYIQNLFAKFITNDVNLSNESITLQFSKAKQQYNFRLFQETADWLFFVKSFYPESLNKASPDYYNIIAQNSYYRCYLMINRQWTLFEELSDKFNYLTTEIHRSVSQLSFQK